MKTVWIFDQNHRVYERDENGKSKGGCIYREHWRETDIIGETKQSWLLPYPRWISGKNVDRVPKNKPVYWAKFSQEEVEEHCWIEDSAGKVGSEFITFTRFIKNRRL